MDHKIISKGLLDLIIKLTFICIGIYGLYLLRSVLIYVTIAAVIALMAFPIKLYLKEKFRLSKNTALAAVIGGFAVILTLFISLFIPLIMEEAHNLSLGNLTEFEANIDETFLSINKYTLKYGIDLSIINVGDLIQQKIHSTPIAFSSIINTIGTLSVGVFSVSFIAFFFMKESEFIGDFFTSIIPTHKEKAVMSSLLKIKRLLSRYFVGLAFQVLIIFIIYFFSLMVIGVNNSLVIAFLCAILNLIPYVGPLIGLGLMVVLALSENLGLDFKTQLVPLVSQIAIMYGVAQFIDNNISQPYIFSKSVNSHPLEIFLVIFVFGVLFGIVGMIIAVPFYTVLKVILKEFYPNHPLVVALAENI